MLRLRGISNRIHKEHLQALPTEERDAHIYLLAWAGGCFDAISFLGLGRVFPANMTGNTVLLGINLARLEFPAILRTAIALLGFCLGVFICTLITERGRGRSGWIPHITTAMVTEFVVLLIFASAWLLTGTKPSANAVDVMIVLAAIAMGLQSTIVRYYGLAGITTTYITGTLTSFFAGIAQRVRPVTHMPQEDASPKKQLLHVQALMWGIYLFATVAGAVGEEHFPVAVIWLPIAAVALVALDLVFR
jgi:uncharacterized membrane protein YoaK (UPF0700 family)